MARRPRPFWSYRAARRNMARGDDPAYPFIPHRPTAVHQFDRLTLRSIVRKARRSALTDEQLGWLAKRKTG